MDAFEFCKELKRIISLYCKEPEFCEKCPLDRFRKEHNAHCTDVCNLTDIQMQARIDVVEEWSKEHPVKTMAQDFFEKFPNAPTYSGCKTPVICPNDCGYKVEPGCEGDHDCVTCWNRPLED